MTEAHAVYSPSSSHRWIECTASAEAIQHVPPHDDLYGNGEHDTGTEAHAEIERCLGMCDGEGEGVGGGDFLALVEDVNPAHPAAHGIALVLAYVRQLVTVTPGRLWIERRVFLTADIWGRSDVFHWDAVNQILTILDYKNGYIDVQVEANSQLRIYGAAVILTHKLPAKWIRYVVVQPNSFQPVPRVKQWIESADQLYGWANAVSKIPSQPKAFKAGEHCDYCPLFGQCPATKDLLQHLTSVFANRPDRIPPQYIKQIAALKKPIDHWFNAFEKHALKQALGEGIQPGMLIVTGVKHRQWNDVDMARNYVLSKKGVKALSPPTPAQAEAMGLDVSGLVDKPEGGPVLAFEGDPRKPWKPKTATEMFASVLSGATTP
jgi:hypothetical protein